MKISYPFDLYDAPVAANLKDVLETAAAKYGHRPAFVTAAKIGDPLQKISYSHFRDDVRYTALGLMSALKIDLSRRDSKKIAIIAPNSYHWAVAYFAITCLGQVAVPLNPGLSATDLHALITRAGATSVFFTSDTAAKIAQLQQTLVKMKHFISLDDSPQATITWAKVYAMGRRFSKRHPGAWSRVKIFSESLAELLFTSGTTSAPKAVMLTHKNICACINGINLVNRFCDDTMLAMLPLYHSYECTIGLCLQIFDGTTLYYLPGGLPHFADNLKISRPTAIMAVPLIVEGTYQRVVAECGQGASQAQISAALRDYYGGRCQRVFVGGAAVNSVITDAYEEAGMKVMQGYGISECSPAVCMNPDKMHKHRSVGMPLPTLRVKINEPNSEGVGEVLVRGPSVMLGYYKDERRTDETLIDNWLHTGDLGKFDDDGFLYLVGRARNVIIGKNAETVYPEEIEFVLNNCPGIKEAMVYGKVVGDDTKVAALLVPDREYWSQRDDSVLNDAVAMQARLQQVVDAANQDLVRYKQVRDISVVDNLPKTATGKIKRQ
ncbi:AMP-binding protein [bacterium]|nr:AMP-binding protein [bacterium]